CETLLAQNQVHFMLAHAHPGVRGPLNDADFLSVVVGSDQLIPVSAPDESGRPRHRVPAAGKGTSVQWLGYSAESGLGRILRELQGPALDRLHVHQVMTAHLASVLRTMALDQRGMAWLPQLLVGDDVASGRLVIAAPEDWRIDLQIRLYRRRGDVGKAAEAFWKAATAAAQPA
ncbi:partial HTH-type transcriptional regulator YjiE, partial [Planctomycetaceae bacterium]